jgi:hypothetical protein
MRSREHLFPAEAKIESFLTDLAVHANVAPATQNQAMNALVFLYKRVLNHPLQDSINAVRADKKMNVPVIMTREEVAAVISLMDGTAQVVAKLLYGNGLRIMEAVWLRVKDVDFQRKFFQRACPLLPALDIVGIFTGFFRKLSTVADSYDPDRLLSNGCKELFAPRRSEKNFQGFVSLNKESASARTASRSYPSPASISFSPRARRRKISISCWECLYMLPFLTNHLLKFFFS